MLGVAYFIETNFYGGGGSKLKSTAGEYKEMITFWADHIHTNEDGKKCESEFIWITDGASWHSAKAPLREFFDPFARVVKFAMFTR